MENAFNEIINRPDMFDERISEPEEKLIEISWTKIQKKKKKNENERSKYSRTLEISKGIKCA